ncbi:MAG: hypothetical protein ACI82Z_000381 [Cellvibrionaceae bacterium]
MVQTKASAHDLYSLRPSKFQSQKPDKNNTIAEADRLKPMVLTLKETNKIIPKILLALATDFVKMQKPKVADTI